MASLISIPYHVRIIETIQSIYIYADGGNILINIGPGADGTIATIFQERLTEMGAWLSVNGEAIYQTEMWREHNDTASHGVGRGVYYTAKGSVVYAFAMGWPTGNRLALRIPKPTAHVTVSLLGCEKPMKYEARGGSGGGAQTSFLRHFKNKQKLNVLPRQARDKT